MKIVSLVGARPQFVKEAMINAEVRATGAWEHVLVHSGQHYDANMSDVFFRELNIPAPAYNLGIGSGSHAEMTAETLKGMERVLMGERPDALIVYGDTDTTLAGALAAAKLDVPVIHIEAGIRMLPRSMPEEINRVLTDRISSVFCCCSALGADNLRGEGIEKGVHVTGDIMYDVFKKMSPLFDPPSTCLKLGLKEKPYILATIHRDYNTDKPEILRAILQSLEKTAIELGRKIIFPTHPRVRKNLAALNRQPVGIHLTDPLGYIELISLLLGADFVITDSGGLQREAYYADKRAVLVMPDTGWRELVENGWNILSGPENIHTSCLRLCGPYEPQIGIYGNGDASSQIIKSILSNRDILKK